MQRIAGMRPAGSRFWVRLSVRIALLFAMAIAMGVPILRDVLREDLPPLEGRAALRQVVGEYETAISVIADLCVPLFLVLVAIPYFAAGRPYVEETPRRGSTIARLLLRKRVWQTKLVVALAVGAAIYGRFFFGNNWSGAHQYVLWSVAFAAVAYTGLLAYRVTTGRFGNSDDELRELLSFVVSSKNKDDFRGPGGGVCSLFDEERAPETKELPNAAEVRP
jgi:hypothetical protein